MNCISYVCHSVTFPKMFDFFFTIFGISLVIIQLHGIIGKRETNKKREQRKKAPGTYIFIQMKIVV